MATNKLKLNKARRLNDGTYPLVMQILHLRKKRVIYLGIHLHLDEFNEKTEQMVTSNKHFRRQKEIKAKRHTIRKSVEQLRGIIEKLDQSGVPYTCDTIIDLYRMGDDNASLVRLWQNKIDQHRAQRKFGIANAQQYTLHSVIHFAGSVHIKIGDITHEFIQSYEYHLKDRELSPNTICYYMRNFKTIMNSAIKEGFTERQTSILFKGIKTSPRKTLKRAITRDELRALSQMVFKNEPLLQFARDLFMFSFYTRGMAFVDIAFLHHDNLSGNALAYSRQKTGQFLHMSINEPMKRLISRYCGVSHYLFPIVFSSDQETAYKEYRSALRRTNKALKIIGERLNLNVSLTTYVARHSWATQAKQHGYPLAVISEGLGHSSENITQIYLKEFDHSILDQANEVITSL